MIPSFTPRRRMPLTREGFFWLLIALAMLVTGLIKAINLINLLACWVLMLLAWNGWMARRQLRRLTLTRTAPDFLFAGTPFPWTVSLANAQKRPAGSVTVTEEAASRSWFVVGVPARQSVSLAGEAILPLRGLHVWRRLRLASGYPVGLAHVERHFDLPLELLVAPRLGQLQRSVLRRWLSQHCLTQGMVRAAARRQPTAQLEFHGLRNFRPGDSPRHIHWRTTARRGEIMVREFEDLPNDNLMLVVDPWTPAPALPGANADLEQLLSLAATICWEWCRQRGDDMALAIAGTPPMWRRGVTGRDLAATMFRDLALVNGDPGVTWQALLARLHEVPLPEAAVLVLTLRSDVPLAELAECLRRPVACANVGAGEEQAFFTASAIGS